MCVVVEVGCALPFGLCLSLALARCWQPRRRPQNGLDCDIVGLGDALLPLAARRNCCSGCSSAAGGVSALAPSKEGMPSPRAAFLAVSCYPRGPGTRQSLSTLAPLQRWLLPLL